MRGRGIRILSLFVPQLFAVITWNRLHTTLLHEAGSALVAIWVVMASALAMRWLEVRMPMAGTRASTGERESPWRQVDLLTSSGAAMMWLSAGSLVAASRLGWASLSVVGMLGLGTAQVLVAWTAIVAASPERWRGAVVTRAIAPALVVEGEPVREEIEIAGVRAPIGMRLFAIGRAFRNGLMSRYAIDPDSAGTRIKLASELGAAPRGDHDVPPLSLWFGDVLGLTRTPPVRLGATKCCVLPRTPVLDGARALLGPGRDAMREQPDRRPTEGAMRIREYQPGDDTRRIHWVRSLQQDQLVVRLPDEVPLGEPDVRLVLDTELVGADTLTCRALDELLDAMIRVWLGVARELEAGGARVVLVTALPSAEGVVRSEQPFRTRSAYDGLRLGARVAWQGEIPVESLIHESRARHVVVSYRRRPTRAEVTWVAVPEMAWTSAEPSLAVRTPLRLPYASGSPDNRPVRMQDERRRILAMWQDRNVLRELTCWTVWGACSGDFVARPRGERIDLVVVP